MESRRRIKRLDTEIVNRIAAGEVVKRPANALKELLENSLDANATSIQIIVKDGGMKYLQIQDNGCGIDKNDLEVVCERFTTSKLETFNELRSIRTYGFRGEALCSISLVSHVTIVTKTADERCGYKIIYRDGKMKGLPVPCGANQGTQITVENLFYNVPTRHKMLKNFNEEFTKIKEVVANYAIHNASVSFSLRKYGRDELFVKTLSNSTCIDNIRSIYGYKIARDLLEANEVDATLQLSYHVLTTRLEYHAPQLTFLLFINHRLVDAEGLRKQLDLLYSNYLPQGTHPFIYLSIEMAPENIDVNVHPTKHRVFYLHEETINNKIRTRVQQLILESQGSCFLPVREFSTAQLNNPLVHESSSLSKSKSEVIYPYEKVRIDSSEQKIDRFLQPVTNSESIRSECVIKDSYKGTVTKNSIETLTNDFQSNYSWKDSPYQIIEKQLNTENIESALQKSIRLDSQKTSELVTPQNISSPIEFEKSPSKFVKNYLSRENIEDETALLAVKSVDSENKLLANTRVENKDPQEDNNVLNQRLAASPKPSTSNSVDIGANPIESMENIIDSSAPSSGIMLAARREFLLTSLESLRKSVVDNCDQELKRILRSSVYVGCLEYKYMLLQHSTNLYLCNVQHLCETFFYQVLLCEFGNFGIITLSQPTSLKFLLKNALKGDHSSELIETLCNRLRDKSEMLEDYFSIKIDKEGNILSFPWLLEKYYPIVSYFPEYVLKLATEVSWDEELPCIQGICLETARFYSKIPNKCNNPKQAKEWNWTLEHIIFPKIKRYVFPPKSFIKSWSLCHIARFKDLFSIFERC